MSATEQRGPATQSARIELVDNWHKDWPKVVSAVGTYGDASRLHIDQDGWLSARQSLLVAFMGDDVAAHICFHVEPSQRLDRKKRACVEAKLDSFGIDPAFCGRGVESRLRRAALERARALQCSELHGFDLKEDWC